MKIITNYERLKERLRDPVLAIGNFDGVHLGHQTILKSTVKEANRIKGIPIALTFHPHPLRVLTPEKCPPLITSFQKKAELIKNCGIEILINIVFTKQFSKMRARAFAEDVIYKEIGAKEVFVGNNFTFGRGKEGDSKALLELGNEFGFKVNIVKSFRIEQKIVSSSNIRKLITKGKVKEGKVLLGRYHSIRGKVIYSAKRGMRLGFPTANLQILGFLIPSVGVYAAKINLYNKTHNGVSYIGFNPTFQRDILLVEAHIFDFHERIYGESIEISFIERIRGEEFFETEKELVNQISKDIEAAKTILGIET